MTGLAAFAAGLLFAVGLVISGMTWPENVVGFLDFFGDWKPALAFVMAGALAVYAAAYRWVIRRKAPLFSAAFEIPNKKTVDAPLLLGAAAFGIGWGLAGFCPGPALAALGSGAMETVVFLSAMIFAVALFHVATRTSDTSPNNRSCG